MTTYRVELASMGACVVMHDDKLQKLIRLLKSKETAGRKVLNFTEFADTVIECGIKSVSSAQKKADRWTKREAAARKAKLAQVSK